MKRADWSRAKEGKEGGTMEKGKTGVGETSGVGWGGVMGTVEREGGQGGWWKVVWQREGENGGEADPDYSTEGIRRSC